MLFQAGSLLSQAAPSGPRVTVLGARPPAVFGEILSGVGGEQVSSDPNVMIISTAAIVGAADVEAARTLLQKGGSLIVYLAGRSDKQEQFSDLVPTNLWTAKEEYYRRGGTGAVAPAGSPFATVFQTPGFAMKSHFDLHLPYSSIELGQQRYEWQRLGKPLWNTDWRVLLVSDQGGQLPLLVEGRVYAGKAFVFGGDLFGKELAAWPGYDGFLKELLTLARPGSVGPATDVTGLKVSVPLHQSSDQLTLEVENPGAQPVPATVFVKVRNLVRGLLLSQSADVTVPARGKITVPLQAGMTAPGDPAFVRVETAVAPQSRNEIFNLAEAIVDRTPALTVELVGEDVRAFPEKNGWPAGGVNILDGSGVPLGRYVYFAGEKPKVKIYVGNAFHNIAPLAKASDVAWPENPSSQGLNDGAVSYGDVRGKFDVFGFWVGREASAQEIKLTWPEPVTVAGQRLFGQSDYRKWDRTNPKSYELRTDGASEPAVAVEKADYDFWRRQDLFPARQTSQCTLAISGLPIGTTQEPTPFRSVEGLKQTAINCALGEWEVFGWPGVQAPAVATGVLRVVAHDLSQNKETVLLEKEISVDPFSRQTFDVEVPARDSLGQVVIRSEFKAGSAVAQGSVPVLFVPEEGERLISRAELGEENMGLLCSPGFFGLEEFGKGTHADTQGWGGPDDKVWAWTHDLMEIGVSNQETVRRFFLSPVGLSHYTNPWREFPSGEYVWDWATDQLLEKFSTGRSKGKKSVHIVLSDRWNGVPTNASFAWSDLVNFDEYLRAQGKPGLTMRTRKDLATEIATKHSAEYQVFQLERYADAMERSQKRLAEAGIAMTVETHGSFPLAGGALGEKLGKTHKAVGTDLFWEFRDEDLYKSIGYRFGLVAANPDLESGAYNQWGWISGALANPTWFSPSGEIEPSRRQWYSTYWSGRVNSEGQFRPYTIYGFSLQGNYGVKNTPADWDAFNKVQSFMINCRPERPTGFGLVTSWQLQENRMGEDSSRLGFGLYTKKGSEQVDQMAGELYQRLVSDGVPVSFVASTHTLKKWEGTQPLVVVDGFECDAWEIAELDRLNQKGTPIIAVGSENRPDRAEAEAFFGARKTSSGWEAQAGAKVIPGENGEPFAFITQRPGRGPTLFCPEPIKSLNRHQSSRLAELALNIAGDPLTLPEGVAATSFLNGDSLFLALGNQGDDARDLALAVRPALFDPQMKGTDFRVIDLDRGNVVPARWENGALHFQIPCAPNDGRMIQILPSPANI